MDYSDFNLGDLHFHESEDIRKIIKSAIDANASDLHIGSKRKPLMEIGQVYYPVASRELDYEEVFSISNCLFGSDTARTIIERGDYIDSNFTIKHKRKDFDTFPREYRFRLNVFPTTVRGNNVPAITIRQLPPDPPKWVDMKYGEDLFSKFRPPKGIVIVSGPTGSGKSTLLASGIRRIAEEFENEKIVMFEDPIEFVYDSFINDKVIIEQSSVGINVKDFITGMRPFLRRRPTICVVGEARDAETIRASIYAAQTGHLVYTTTHTNGAPETVTRLLNDFPVNEHESRLHNILEAAELFVSQRLFQKVGGGVIALREELHFSQDVKRHIEDANLSNYRRLLREATEMYGKSMVTQAKQLFADGVISEKVFKEIKLDFSRGDNA
ncbi:type IV pilus twitching motility protein PilT [Vibrio sp. D431a]|uniref:type IV pilus twitching motility protein PilT n=1 Tax=Vibrio sp. D431a TaxID=2837388 RepID=UPI002556CD5B|nr:ATPase, T2SS/T4P/T4SS family [Vibrio sp. D431a]MDK9793841.1 Flp pilus assembly complex ATPase component TadA [Vibrio sp. D431a]